MTIYLNETKALLASAKHGRIGLNLFREWLPEIARQVEQDRGTELTKAWGKSLNFDENARQRITDAKLLSAIGRLAKEKMRDGQAYHAGLLHTYGYLLSSIETPFGYKHERWTDGLLDAGFGFPKRTFWSTNDQGTLLGNVTYFLLSTLHAKRPTSTYAPQIRNVSPPILEFDYDALATDGLVETFRIGRKRVALFSRFVRLPKRKSRFLLIYSLQVNSGKEVLVTCFPVTEKIRNGFFESSRIGSQVRIELRFNACFEGCGDKAFEGSRAIEKA